MTRSKTPYNPKGQPRAARRNMQNPETAGAGLDSAIIANTAQTSCTLIRELTKTPTISSNNPDKTEYDLAS